MKKIYLVTALLAVILVQAEIAYSENIPAPKGWVNDFAGVIWPEYRDKITSIVEELQQKASAEIMVVTVNSIAPHDEKSYARLLFDSWKPGKKGKDNGVIVLLAVKERLWRIETGYGVEGILPDGKCGEIGRSYMVDNFKEGLYGKGLYNGVLAIANIIADDAGVKLSLQPINNASEPSVDEWLPYVMFILLLFLLFVLPRLIYSANKSGGHGAYYGGGFGGGGFGGGGFGGGCGGFGGGGGAGGRF